MRLNQYFDQLKHNKLSLTDYLSLRRQCLRMVRQACRRYKLDDMLTNQVLKREIVDNIFIKSITKSLEHYQKSKGAFSTYFYYKVMSAARVEAGKAKRRLAIENTVPLDEQLMTKKNKKKQHNQGE